jgi:hypothetical protein
MSWLQTEESPRTQTLCPQNVAWMRKHLELCDTLHYAGLTSTFQPTRLLDLGDDKTKKDFRLIETAHGHADQALQYAALSYCWGLEKYAKRQLKALMSNFQQHHNVIEFNTATPVVQDAVMTARALSIRYLWIDALCIIQDDGADWANESGKMGMVYANAYVTFCTLTSTSCMEGFLARPPTVNIKFNSKMRPSVQGIYSLRHQRSWNRMATSVVNMEQHDFYVAGTWSTRAWTLQEQHLSKRRVYFGCSRIYLHCSEDEMSEPRDYSNDQGNKNHDSFRDHVLRFRKDQNVRLLHHRWEELIDGYVSRQATYMTDTLPALSGLARTMAVELGDTYLAGLWKSDLPRGLLWTKVSVIDDWHSLRDRLAPEPQKPYIVPSWSWASTCVGSGYDPFHFTTNARIRSDFPGLLAEDVEEDEIETGFRSECTVVAAWCTPVFADVNEYGQIKDGELHVEGKLKRCPSSWVRDPRPEDCYDLWTAVGDDTTPAVCAMDFSVSKETQELQLDHVHLLLLSSSCGYNAYWPQRRDYENALSLLNDSDADSIKQTYLALSQKLESDNEEVDEEVEDVYEGSESESEDDSEDSSTQGTGSSCSNFTPKQRAKQRNAWGLLVHQHAGTDKFIRVGVFRVSFERGGIRAFDDQPVSLVKLL